MDDRVCSLFQVRIAKIVMSTECGVFVAVGQHYGIIDYSTAEHRPRM